VKRPDRFQIQRAPSRLSEKPLPPGWRRSGEGLEQADRPRLLGQLEQDREQLAGSFAARVERLRPMRHCSLEIASACPIAACGDLNRWIGGHELGRLFDQRNGTGFLSRLLRQTREP
jgi:hypothetical protein